MAQRGNNPALQVAALVVRSRRLLATAFALVIALLCAWHAFFGQNGITAYAQKRSEDQALRSRIDKLAEQNRLLTEHVEQLRSDPDAIELEARERLHYTRKGEVIYTLNLPPAPHGR